MSDIVHAATHEAAPWIEKLARFGYAAKGAVHLIVGGLAAAAGTRGASSHADHSEAFQFVREQPFGKTLLFILAAGLIGYALWRIGSALGDWEQRGSDGKGLAVRLGSFARGLIYGAVAAGVIRLARTGAETSGSDSKAQHWTARAMDQPFGRWLVVLVGAGIVGYGVYQLYLAWKAKLSKQLRIRNLSPTARTRVIGISRFGIAARGVVFMVIGGSIVQAALQHDADRARGTAGALSALGEYGPLVLTLIGLGLAAYGIYALVNARYRLISAVHG